MSSSCRLASMYVLGKSACSIVAPYCGASFQISSTYIDTLSCSAENGTGERKSIG